MPAQRPGNSGPGRRNVRQGVRHRPGRPEPASGGGVPWIVGGLGVACLGVAGYMLWNETSSSPGNQGFDLAQSSPLPVPVRARSRAPASADRDGSRDESAPDGVEPGPSASSPASASAGSHPGAASGLEPSARGGKAAPAGPETTAENKLFTLQLSGSLQDRALDPEDAQTWARLGYCLTQECAARHWLVFPDGGIPIIQPPSALAGAAKGKPAAAPPPPAGDRRRPTFRLVLEARAQPAGKIVFYGRELASKYECRITCAIEKRVAGTGNFVRLDLVTAEEKISPAKDTKDPPEALLRLCYDAALDRLAANLKGHAFFAASGGAPAGAKKKTPAQKAKKP